MRGWAGKRYWLIGGSAGLGLEVARCISAAGAEVILSARDEEGLRAAAARMPGPSRIVVCDVADGASVARAAEEAGTIDGMCYLAGVYWPQSARAWDRDQVTAMFDVNLTGAARVLGHVVPAMLSRGRGHIVLTGSLAGFRGMPNSIGYGASKSGLMTLAESIHADLRGSGVDVQLVNPGFVRTRLTDKNDFRMPLIMEPDAAAKIYFEHMNSDGFSRSYPRALGVVIRAANFLPDGLYYRLFS